MAINTKSQEGVEELDPLMSRLSSLGSIVLALGGAALVLVLALTNKLSLGGGAYVAGWIILLAFVIGASVQLLRGQVWAQRFLLIFWMLTAMACLLLVLSHVLSGMPSWWPGELNIWYVVLPAFVLSAAAAALLTLTAPPNTRLRYGTFSCVAVAIALTLVVVVNLIGQSDPIHVDLESVGSYGVSERTRTILAGVEQPITATVVYTSADEKRLGRDFAPRVLDQLEEMKIRLRQLRKDASFDIVNVTSDTQKARLLTRIRDKITKQAGGHVQVIRSIDGQAGKLIEDLESEAKAWDALGPSAYANYWSLGEQMKLVLTELVGGVRKLCEKVKRETQATSLTDYASLVNDVKSVVEDTQKPLEQIGGQIEPLAKIPGEVAKNRPAALAAVQKALQAVGAMQAAIGDKAPAPAEAAKALKALAKAGAAADDQLVAAADALTDVAGKEHAKFLRICRLWVVRMGDQRAELGMLFRMMSQMAGGIAEEAAAWAEKLTPEAMVEQIQGRRPDLNALVMMVDQAAKAAAFALDQLAKIDPESQKLLNRPQGGKPFENITRQLQAIGDQIKKLPELKEDSLVRDLSQENIVILEVGDKARVVPFDEVYPVRAREMGMALRPEEEKRTFNGDSALASKILGMTRKPFATVLMTCLAPDPMMAQRMRGLITPAAFGALRKQLEDANFQVAEWDLAQEQPAPAWVCGACGKEDSKSPTAPAKCEQCGAEGKFEKRPQVLLILPPNPPMPNMMGGPPPPGFGPEQVDKIRRAIDSGTPGIFLASFIGASMFGPPSTYPLNDYLRETWGVECPSDVRLIPGEPDPKTPDKYKINAMAFVYMPISSFTNQKIGRPLQGQRTVWNNVCPVQKVADPPGVSTEPILVVPESHRNIWATRKLSEMIQRIRSQPGTLVSPEPGDLRPPLTLALAAIRDAAPPKDESASRPATRASVTPARVVVMGLGQSFLDGYLDEPISLLGEKTEYDVTDPPRANADLVVNSAYWLCANDRYIAAGPVRVKPVNVSESTRQWLWVLCVIGLPLIVVGVGAVVLLTRRA